MPRPLVTSPETALANALGITRETCVRYLAMGMPRDIAAARAWIAAKPDRKGGRPSTKPKDWRDRKARADALRSEAALARESRQVLPRAEVERMHVEWVDAFVSALEAAPPKLTPLLVSARGHSEVETILNQYFRAIRVQLCAQCSLPVEEVVSDGEPAAHPDDEEDA